ncbi:DUF2652 domain-containing protein [Maribacter hydrothermalis]|uniref:DUF2652 domain-containing protein n=1 Tax=Maribacter hydrothermalis TaxID=1836467 RepID=A0A1B7Z1A6_9FLAO|nr:DUF2652 domain-containing protein [Maribacter hydrothermalis]APQ18148.1 hypothetical protein BTR34_12800 [Maribacter hydrothermalis]OBR36495.1 hypothetical protein A9200_08690 [Maribacter hydrothermalis]
MQAKSTIVCIPDISGFTSFMSDFDFDLASKVIPSLLNNIIYSNDIGFKVSEIEGDAVLFYRNGKLPKLGDLIAQCRFFYTEFYKQLEQLKIKYKGKKGASKIPKVLGLKIILHYSEEIGLVQIGKQIKLIGEDVITTHRLLKNNIEISEYILISDALMDMYTSESIDDKVDWTPIKKGEIQEEHLGKVGFTYIDLTPLLE